MMLNHGPQLLFILMTWETKILRKYMDQHKPTATGAKESRNLSKKIISRDVTIIKCKDLNGFVTL